MTSIILHVKLLISLHTVYLTSHHEVAIDCSDTMFTNISVSNSTLIIFSIIGYVTHSFFIHFGIAIFNWVFNFFKKC